MCIYFLCSNPLQKTVIIKNFAIKERVSLLETISNEPIHASRPERVKYDDVIYKSSPFYKDFLAIYESALKTFPCESASKGQEYLKHLLRYRLPFAPWWTALCHKPKKNTSTFKSPFRFATAAVESHWSNIKEALRAQTITTGKIPIPADRLVTFLKDNVRANTIRYRSCIPTERLNARKGTFLKKTTHTLNNDFKFLVASNFVNPGFKLNHELKWNELNKVQAKWKRTAAADATPRTSGVQRRQLKRRLFACDFSRLAKVDKTAINFYDALWANQELHNRETSIYIGNIAYYERTVKLDLKDLYSLKSGALYDSAVEFAIVSKFQYDKEHFVVDIVATRAIMQPTSCYGNKTRSSKKVLLPERVKILEHYVRNVLNMINCKLIFPFCDGIHFYLIIMDIVKKNLKCLIPYDHRFTKRPIVSLLIFSNPWIYSQHRASRKFPI